MNNAVASPATSGRTASRRSFLQTVTRGAHLLLDVGPDKHGLIPERNQSALVRLHQNIDRLGV